MMHFILTVNNDIIRDQLTVFEKYLRATRMTQNQNMVANITKYLIQKIEASQAMHISLVAVKIEGSFTIFRLRILKT